MATSTARFSGAAFLVLAAAIAAVGLPLTEKLAQRSSGRVEREQAYRGSGRVAFRRNSQMAYRASGRMEIAYRGSERGVENAQTAWTQQKAFSSVHV